MNKDLPGDPVVKNLSATAEDMDSIPSLGTSRMPQSSWACVQQLLSPHALEPMLHSKRSHHNQRSEHHSQRVAPTHCN